LVTEYERLLADMVNERRSKVDELRARKAGKKEIDALLSEISFIEVELKRYDGALRLFRTKPVPKVGRWGKAGAAPSGDEASQA
jgi:hypothetical protein